MSSFHALKRRPLASLLAFALLFTAVPLLAKQASAGTDSTEIAAPSGIVISGRADRVDSQPIENVELAGYGFIFMDVSRNVSKVSYYLNDPQGINTPFRVSDTHPFDLEGMSGDQARPFDTTTLDDGVYTLTVNLDLANGRIQVFHAAVVVANGSGAPEVPETEPAPHVDPAPEPSPASDTQPDDPDVDRVMSGEHNGFTVPAGQTWQVNHVTTTANVIVEGTLRMRPDSSLTFADIDEAAFVGGGMKPIASDVGLWVMDSGVLDIQGTPKQGWNRTGNHSTWDLADEIRRAPSAAGDTSTFARHVPGEPVPSIALPDGRELRTEVFNLTRDVVIQGTGDGGPRPESNGRAHIFIASNQPQTIKHVDIRHMGPRRPKDTYTEFVPGRYGLHFHHNGDGSRGSIVEGVVIRDTGSHAFVPHNSHGITFRDTIVHNTFEHAYWWDPDTRSTYPGNASHDILYDRAAAFLTRFDPAFRGFSLGGFWFAQGEGNACVKCVAAGVQGNKNAAGFVWAEDHNNMPNVWRFEDSVSHNNRVNGILVWQNDGNEHVIDRFTGYRNGLAGIDHGAYLNTYRYNDAVLADNPVGVRHHAQTAASIQHDLPLRWDNLTIRGQVGFLTLKHRGEGPPVQVNGGRWDTDRPIVIRESPDGAFKAAYDFNGVLNRGRDLQPEDVTVEHILDGSVYSVFRSDGTSFKVGPN